MLVQLLSNGRNAVRGPAHRGIGAAHCLEKRTPKGALAPKNESPDVRHEPGTGHSIASFLTELEAARRRILQPLQHANERCIDMLVQAARADDQGTFPLVTQLRELLTRLTPEIRARAARKPFLLVDFQFGNDA
jgi:hypothetical protein